MVGNIKCMCTIVAKNYISFARTLCESFLKHNPSGKCYVLVVDEIKSYIDSTQDAFEVLTIEQLNIPNLREFCFKYNITELCTAVKPFFMKHLLESEGMDSLLYFDPDILVINPLDGLYHSLLKNDIILTPHLDTDFPDDGKRPNDSIIMQSGIFNLGFIGIRNNNNSINFLTWWQNKLYNKCLIDRLAGFFVDQKFMDYAFVLFPNIGIIKDTGYNVAYWNIHSRVIEEIDNTWTCNGKPLYFYHFSNYRAENPENLSGFQNRYNLSSIPALRKLFLLYRTLLEDNGYQTSRLFPYTYGYFNTGLSIHNIVRKYYRSGMFTTNNSEDPFDFKGYTIISKLKIYILLGYKKTTKWLINLFNKV